MVTAVLLFDYTAQVSPCATKNREKLNGTPTEFVETSV